MNKYLYVIGIDGGGTKTTAVLCSLDGLILSEAEGGPSNFQIIGAKQSANTILDLIETCCHSVGCRNSEIGAIVAGLAGVGRTSDKEEITEEILTSAKQRNLLLNKVFVESDARIALEGAFSGEPGIIIIGGTGSIVFGKDEKDKIYRAGGWGRIIGDEGSGYSIGREALRAVAKVLDGYAEKTLIQKILQDKYNLVTQEDIINAVYKKDFAIASLAPDVLDAAQKGDKIGKKILKQSCIDLINMVQSVVNNMNKGKRKTSKFGLALSGSLLLNENIYAKMIRTAIKKKLPGARIRKPESSPVVGAALMAIREIKLQK